MSALITLDESYRACRRLNRRFGSTYYWAASLLPPEKRRQVHALYGFCRYADDIVDQQPQLIASERARLLEDFGARFFHDLDAGVSDDEVLCAVVDTVRTLRIDPVCFERFLHSMTMDLTRRSYETFDDLMEYMDGSAAVIGEMMLPVLEPSSPRAFEPARDLGIAFQLTNFLRDVGEDLDRGRVYIPQTTLRTFGADPRRRVADDAWVAALRFEIERTRSIYRQADVGIGLLPTRTRRCVQVARSLYSDILGRIEANNYDVFGRRARVSHWKKLAAAARLVA